MIQIVDLKKKRNQIQKKVRWFYFIIKKERKEGMRDNKYKGNRERSNLTAPGAELVNPSLAPRG